MLQQLDASHRPESQAHTVRETRLSYSLLTFMIWMPSVLRIVPTMPASARESFT